MTNHRPPAAIWLPVLAVTLMLAGCGPATFSSRLVGKWSGRPETAEQRATRTPADRIASGGSAPQEGVDEVFAEVAPIAEEAANLERTDLEAFDVVVSLELGPTGEATMSVGEDRQGALAGTWRVVSSELDRAVLEITARRSGSAEGEQPAEEKRRFAVQLMESDDAFTLIEENTDRRFGALYFRRQP